MTDEELIKQSDQLMKLKSELRKTGINDAGVQAYHCYIALTGILAAIESQTEAINRLTGAIYAVSANK